MRYYAYQVVTPNANPRTLFQVGAPANQRVLIHGGDFSLAGSDPSTVPVLFDWLLQDDAGTASGLTQQYQDRQTSPLQTVQATLQHTATVEPTPNSILIYFTIHQQGTYLWRPVFPIWVGGGEFVGLRYRSSTYVDVTFTLYIEE